MLHFFEQDLSAYNTLGLHSIAREVLRYHHQDQLPALSERLAAEHGESFVLGGGSNVVLAPRLDCLVIKVESRGVRLLSDANGELLVEAEAGEIWHDFVQHCVNQGWNGLENLALIPGTVGAAPVQNIGAYGVELDQRMHSLSAWDLVAGRMVDMDAEACGFSYRHSVFKEAQAGRWLIVRVRFKLSTADAWRPVLDYPDLRRHPQLQGSGDGATARQIFDAVCEIRRSKLPDPAVLGNAGSFFKNPIISADVYEALKRAHPQLVAYPQEDGRYKLAAGWLIDRAGWKGRRLGAVGVHDRQALVLVNHGGATAQDIAHLADAIRADIAARFGVQLEQEPVRVS